MSYEDLHKEASTAFGIEFPDSDKTYQECDIAADSRKFNAWRCARDMRDCFIRGYVTGKMAK